jgi:hypothetical protein
MSEVTQFVAQRLTPTNIRQITNLLERGKSKEEIAEIIGVATATLQVKCSQLGISLRRPSVIAHSGLARPPLSRSEAETAPLLRKPDRETVPSQCRNEQIQATPDASHVEKEQTLVQLKHSGPKPAKGADSSSVTLAVRYKGEERRIDLPLDRLALGQLALEAEFRTMSVGALIGEILLSITKNDMFKLMLEDSRGQ